MAGISLYLTLINTYFRLTISTAEKIHDSMKIVDDNGDAQEDHDWCGLGCLRLRMDYQHCFLQGIRQNFGKLILSDHFFLCFQVHPSAVDLETSRFHNKMTLHVFGKEKRIMKKKKGIL